MARSKHVRQAQQPKGRVIASVPFDSDAYYAQHPAWNFSSCDKEYWMLDGECGRACFWDEILPRLKGLESMTWKEIFLEGKKQNHSIPVEDLNKGAQDRLADMYNDAESIISLRLNGTHRLYGFMTGAVFNILWFDPDHGDNTYCVVQSHKRHT